MDPLDHVVVERARVDGLAESELAQGTFHHPAGHRHPGHQRSHAGNRAESGRERRRVARCSHQPAVLDQTLDAIGSGSRAPEGEEAAVGGGRDHGPLQPEGVEQVREEPVGERLDIVQVARRSTDDGVGEAAARSVDEDAAHTVEGSRQPTPAGSRNRRAVDEHHRGAGTELLDANLTSRGQGDTTVEGGHAEGLPEPLLGPAVAVECRPGRRHRRARTVTGTPPSGRLTTMP